jgi:cell division protease FtsH
MQKKFFTVIFYPFILFSMLSMSIDGSNSTRIWTEKRRRRFQNHPLFTIEPENVPQICPNREIISKYNFSRIGGYPNVKRDLLQLKYMLLQKHHYEKYNVRVPKGILLEGPPGNGKTLLAKSFAGECGFSFLSASGSEFNEKYVGVGAARCRELFRKAQENQPCILFIDEIDAIGSKRSSVEDGGSMEKSQTLNQLLVLMDGFDSDKMKEVIVIAATNRKDVLDPALLRSGRFDRIIHIGNPDFNTRKEIIKIHRNKKPISSNITTESIAEITHNMCGADIENVLNEVSLRAMMENRMVTKIEELEETKDNIILGVSITEKEYNDSTLRRIAVHEWGHVFASLLTSTHPLPTKISIRTKSAGTLGVTSFRGHNIGLFTIKELEDHIKTLLGGYIAEKIVYEGNVSSGAHDDLKRVKNLLQQMISDFGMSNFKGDQKQPTLFTSEKDKINLFQEYFEFLYRDIYQQFIFYKKEIEACAMVLLDREIIYQESIFSIIQKTFEESNKLYHFKDNRIIFKEI